VINDIADSIAQIPDAVKRTVYVDFLSREFDIRPAALEERLSRARTKILEEERVKVRREAQAQGGQQGASPDVLPAGAETDPPAMAVNADPLLESAERDLLNFILADGTDPLVFASDSEFYPGDGEEMPTVFEFIASAVEDDGAAFTHPAFERAYRAYAQFYDEGLSQDEIVKRLLDGEDRTVAAVAAALSGEEKYTLTISGLRNAMMSRPSWLTKYVPKAILVFQEARLEHRLAQLRGELAADGAPLETLLQQIKDMQQMLHKVKVRLGREKE
jgi:DNA primase